MTILISTLCDFCELDLTNTYWAAVLHQRLSTKDTKINMTVSILESHSSGEGGCKIGCVPWLEPC